MLSFFKKKPSDIIEFLVQGSGASPYKVTFSKNNKNITAVCTCMAGEKKMHCKHRINILKGDKSAIVSKNSNQIKQVISWLPESDVGKAFDEFCETEIQLLKYQNLMKANKKNLANAFHS